MTVFPGLEKYRLEEFSCRLTHTLSFSQQIAAVESVLILAMVSDLDFVKTKRAKIKLCFSLILNLAYHMWAAKYR